MSDRRAAAGSAEFSELRRSVSKHVHNKNTVNATSPTWKDLQSPKRGPCSRYPGLNNGDSPGDGEASQDIFWDPTSPTQSKGMGLRNNRVMEISDIVNRIAPKNVKPVGTESPLLQWIGDSAIPCTPEIPKPRPRKKSTRQNSVEDLMKLARQFDENMQQDKETSEQLNTVNNNVSKCGNASEIKPTKTALRSNAKEQKCLSSSDQVEAELHALFDSSTQQVSGQLSQGSSTSAISCSQEMKGQPKASDSAKPHQSELKSTDKCGSASHLAEDVGSRGITSNTCDDFDDDWENDDLLNDSFVLAMTHDTMPKTTLESNSKMNTTPYTSVCKPATNTEPVGQFSSSSLQLGCGTLQELCPKPKTTNRSTFKLESNPHFQPKTTKSTMTRIQPSKLQMSDQKSNVTKTSTSMTLSAAHSDKPDSNDQAVKGAIVAADSVKDMSDSLWGDGVDDELLYQVCDTMERISNSHSQQANFRDCQEKQDIAVDRQRKATAPLPVEMASSINARASANRELPCTFSHSNSVPGTSCNTVNYQGWNIPMKGANSEARMSRSLPGRRVSLSTFSQFTNSSGTFQTVNANPDMQPHTVTARPPQNCKSHHAAFKRNVSDSGMAGNKVFVTSKMTGKCSAADIERKKQEALARRRLRMQNTPKP
ncbi:hypothetical protein LDENG_00040630 [Lucifuga dentata]|nr:hypothetical protein LDENG_00040630 [Lucifuga dentata]